MKLTFILVATLTLSVIATTTSAQQQVWLKSGARIVGEAKVQGDNVVVRVGESTITTPLGDVAEIAATPIAAETVQRRLLTAALEAKILQGTTAVVTGILGEAYRIDPDDPQIAFWYATSLMDGGHGKAANEVLQSQGSAIARMFPGDFDRLATRIYDRMAFEKLPSDLIQRIDEINSPSAGEQCRRNQPLRYYALFHLVDQFDRGVQRKSVYVNCNGVDKELEAFRNGYFLFSFTRNHDSENPPCRVSLVEIGVKDAEFELQAVAGGVRGKPVEMVAHRFEPSELRPIRVIVKNRDGQPIRNATVVLELASRRGLGNRGKEQRQVDSSGVVQFEAYPLDQLIHVEAPGYKQASERIQLADAPAAEIERTVRLYPEVTASIQVVWMWRSDAVGDHASGEALITAGKVQQPYEDPHWIRNSIRAAQHANRLAINFGFSPMGGFETRTGEKFWLRQIEVESHGDNILAEAVRERFEAIDLKKIDEVRTATDAIEASWLPGQSAMHSQLTGNPGTIYVGKLPHTHVQSRQPGTLIFKVMVDESTGPAVVGER